jgi:hypothetical protein
LSTPLRAASSACATFSSARRCLMTYAGIGYTTTPGAELALAAAARARAR